MPVFYRAVWETADTAPDMYEQDSAKLGGNSRWFSKRRKRLEHREGLRRKGRGNVSVWIGNERQLRVKVNCHRGDE